MREFDIVVSPEDGFDQERLKNLLIKNGTISNEEYIQILRRSIDARQRKIKVNLHIKPTELFDALTTIGSGLCLTFGVQ